MDQNYLAAPRFLGYDLSAALRCISLNPAQAFGLDERGSIEPGKRADLLRVGHHRDLPLLNVIWKAGNRVGK